MIWSNVDCFIIGELKVKDKGHSDWWDGLSLSTRDDIEDSLSKSTGRVYFGYEILTVRVELD